MFDMDDDDILFRFKLVPHRGLSRIAFALRMLKVSLHTSKWQYIHREDAQRVERAAPAGTRLTLGVSRQPFVGFISWASVHQLNEENESSAILRICYQETSKIWSCDYVPGAIGNGEIDRAIAELFADRTRSFVFQNEDMVNAYIQRFVDIYEQDA